ncbi:MAG: group 1 truncated hemoglobin [Maioricimonas sp. JB049]
MSENGRTLYDQIGGAGILARLIDEFYDHVLADPELAPFFAETSMEKQRRMQREFFAAALGGPQMMSDIDLAYAHHGRGITPEHFNRFVQHLLETLQELEISDHDVDEIIRRISTYVDDITGDAPATA